MKFTRIDVPRKDDGASEAHIEIHYRPHGFAFDVEATYFSVAVRGHVLLVELEDINNLATMIQRAGLQSDTMNAGKPPLSMETEPDCVVSCVSDDTERRAQDAG